MTQSQIIAIGGGGLSDEAKAGLDIYVLEQSQTSQPKIGFLGTASGDSEVLYPLFQTQLSAFTPHLFPLKATMFVIDYVIAHELANL